VNILKKLMSLLKKETPDEECCEEPTQSCGEVLTQILRAENVKMRDVAKVNGVALFEEWYDGPCTEESIRAAIPDFKLQCSAFAAKLAGKL
jgi:hypothetical protein